MLVHVADSQLNYEWIEPKITNNAEHVIVFLHEALGSIGQWKAFPQRLCDTVGLQGLVYERTGHGASSPITTNRTDRYLHEYALEELPAFLNAVLPETKKIVLVGHSDGGTIALLYAANFPSRISAMITIAAHVINEPETIAGIEPAIEAYQAGKLGGLKKYHGNKTEALFYAWADTWKHHAFKDWNIVNEIQNSQTPGLIIQGTDDQYGTEKQLELIGQTVEKSTLQLLENCGHHPHLEQMEPVISGIKKWLSTLNNHSELLTNP